MASSENNQTTIYHGLRPLLPLFPIPDPGGIGSLGVVDGLISCTETLGFESSDERNTTGAEFQFDAVETPWKPKKTAEKSTESKKRLFPPPMSSLNPDGKRIFYLCPVRCHGRLELTEVKIERSEFLHASREDGRLRLDLVETEEDDQSEEETDVSDYSDEEELEYSTNNEELEGDDDNWLLPAVIGGGGDGGLRRCVEVVSRRHRQDLQGWAQQQQCVISR